MKTLFVRYTIPVAVEVPDDFQVAPEAIAKTGAWLANDYRDGREPFTTETMKDAALRATRAAVLRAIDDQVRERVAAYFRVPENQAYMDHYDGAQRLLAKVADSVRFGRYADLEVACMLVDESVNDEEAAS